MKCEIPKCKNSTDDGVIYYDKDICYPCFEKYTKEQLIKKLKIKLDEKGYAINQCCLNGL